eukprot:CAMPEP_0204901206 /NCGR_PEP_ID=MMETSP1397-20131031/2946_1 /ASSEMBLY_ACC=CAM_ASM_000891 /TAXON_ID=49980 /ORGANISM="Climacostomum Climacostomum virens, Strain Stock W-24" /LENGTH=679 /DNA_ID=CAMNT_0052069523 /DNA_START=147 /DNA_END=2183 /DNA_ORIENTATION=-
MSPEKVRVIKMFRKSRDLAASPISSPRIKLTDTRLSAITRSRDQVPRVELQLDGLQLKKNANTLSQKKTPHDCQVCGCRKCICALEAQLKLVDQLIRDNQGTSSASSPIPMHQRSRKMERLYEESSDSQQSALSGSEEAEISEPSSESDEDEEEKHESYNENELKVSLTVYPADMSIQCLPKAGTTFLIQPLFEERPSTVAFDYPPQCMTQSRLNARCFEMSEAEKLTKKLWFKISDRAPAYNCILNSFRHNGFEQTTSHKFNIIISKVPSPASLKWLSSFQRFNHYPGAWNLGRKDNLWRNVWRMKRAFGSDYEICPNTYILSEDYNRFQAERESAEPTALWILKPAASSCGRGIKVISKKSKVKKKSGFVISKYISNPHIINGFKYDLRIYVCVTSFNPLRIYLYSDGLARFATEQYSSNAKTIKKRYMHLTNYSVNRKAPTFKANVDANADNEGSKWSLRAWATKMREMGVDMKSLMNRIKDVIIKTLISVEPQILNKVASSTQHRDVFFELYGFDILIDSKLRPWLLEVNVGPSLSSSAPIDKRIKTTLMCDIYTLVGVAPYDRKKLEKLEEIKKQKRLIRTERMPLHTSVQTIKSCASLDEVALSKSEIGVLMELEEEAHRRGHFKRIFPKKANFEKYAQYFEADRLFNWITWKYLKSPNSVLGPYIRKGVKVL